MKKDSIIDCLACILFKSLGGVIRLLPRGWVYFLGRRLGDLLYYFDLKHKSIAYSNIKTALDDGLSPWQLSCLTKDFYRDFGQSLLEVFLFPLVDKEYIKKYVDIQGLEHISEGLKRGKGAILLAMHEGSWELSNLVAVNSGVPFLLFVRNQRYPRLNQLLNSYRLQKGCRLIERKNQTRQLIEALGDNQAIGMTLDQGGKAGTLVKFFGKNASLSSGAVRLALKYDTAIVPCFFTRVNGPYLKFFIEPPFVIKKTQDFAADLRGNLQELVSLFEKYILKYPKEYLWSYKIWKYSDEKNILILSDGKTGHLRQSEALADILSDQLKKKGMKISIATLEIKFKNKFKKSALALSACLAGKYHCQGCLWCLRMFLENNVYRSLTSSKPDIVISCGSAVAPVNFIISRENLAKSMVIMRPSLLSVKRFNLVVMPRHDHPPRRKNIVVTEAALNLIDEDYLQTQSEKLLQRAAIGRSAGPYLGLLIGGDTKNFRLRKEVVSDVIRQIKSVSEKNNLDILVTSSRRTSAEIEGLLKKEFGSYARCKFLVIASENSPPFTIGGILGLSSLVVVSPESISMISEAASSGRHIVVFSSKVSRRHRDFLNYFAQKKYIYLAEPQDLSRVSDKILKEQPMVNRLRDRITLSSALEKII